MLISCRFFYKSPNSTEPRNRPPCDDTSPNLLLREENLKGDIQYRLSSPL